MRLNTTTTVEDNLVGEVIPFTIDPAGMGHIMNLLSKVYRDNAEAVLREYAANGWDSHVAAGVGRPIEITLPTLFNPVLTIRDFGLGLSKNDVATLYTSYGRSTKQNDDSQIGAFGIGSKCGFGLSPQFTVVGVKDGWRTVALCSLDANGFPSARILSHEPTEDGNGVAIQITVPDHEAVARAATVLFGTWTPGSVKIDGEMPPSIYEDTLEVAGGMHAAYASRGGHLSVVMGNVAYRASQSLLRQAADGQGSSVRETLSLVGRGLRLWAEVPMGAVDITPSRDDLSNTDRTINALRVIAQTYTENLRPALARTIDAEPTPMEASLRLREFRGLVPGFESKGAEWRGQRLAYTVKVEAPALVLEKSREQGKPGRVLSCSKYETHLGSTVDNVLVVIHDGNENVVRRLANRYLSNHEDVQTLLLTDQPRGAVEWFAWGGRSPLRTITASEFKAKALTFAPSTSRTTGPLSYEVHAFGEARAVLMSDEIAAHEGRIIVTPQTDPLLDHCLAPGDLVVVVTGSRTVKGLQRRLGGRETVDARSLRLAHATKMVEDADDLDLRLVLGLVSPHSPLELLHEVADRINDAALRQAVEDHAVLTARNPVGGERKRLSLAVQALPANAVEALRSRLASQDPLIQVGVEKTYPLLNHTWRSVRYNILPRREALELAEHLLRYVNAPASAPTSEVAA